MLYRFGDFELDLDRIELRAQGSGERIALEPQVFALLALLVDARDRMVSKDELFEKIWDGRIVTDSALASRVKSARQALGDDGRSQRFIRTVHGRGFQFVADVRIAASAPPATSPPLSPSLPMLATAADSPLVAAPHGLPEPKQPSIAVLPFRLAGSASDPYTVTLADALPHELIVDLSRLRWLFVTARASSFRLRDQEIDAFEIGRLLGVRYCLSGTIEQSRGARVHVSVELVDTRDGGVVWAEHYEVPADDIHQVRTEIRASILAALELRIPLHEATLARLGATESLDAWSAFHLGLQHVYRFNRTDTAHAKALFELAVQRDPRFARAHAGLSFVHFQAAFLHQTDDVAGEAARARSFAERALALDPLDPFVNFTMGRTYWLTGELDTALGWLERSTTLSPNFAQGVYARAWTETLAGRGLDGREHVDHAMRLSPLDPLHYAMLGTRALGHMTLAEDDAASQWGDRAARAPGAHVLIAMIAAASHALAGHANRAADWATNVRERSPQLTREDFFRAFPMRPAEPRMRVLQSLEQLGF
jgi:TolB-like protein